MIHTFAVCEVFAASRQLRESQPAGKTIEVNPQIVLIRNLSENHSSARF